MTTMTIEREQKSGEDLYAEREKRVADAIALREPDRVPFSFFTHFWTATYCGHTFEELMYDGDKYTSSLRKALDDLQPDTFAALHINIVIGQTMETMGYKQLEWPGHGTDPNVGYQYIDKEYMKPEEYDDYLFDPTGFFLRTYLPRVATAYEAFAKLPDFPTLYYLKLIRATGAFTRPDLIEAFQTLAEAGRPMEAMMGELKRFAVEAKEAGFPQSIGSGAAAPFDHFADYLRGSKGAMLDMFRHRDKLLEAMDKAAVLIARDAVRSGKGNPFSKQVFIPLHWGLDGFMSPEQFKTFFWPPLRKVMMTLIENGLNPQVLWEGDCESRLETIADVPPGTCVYWFERTDMAKAKAVLGDVVCLRGNVPPSVLNLGTPDDTDEYVKNLIKVAGKGGGLIVDGALGIPDEARPENVFAMAKAVRKYGAYG
ncbi:MAG: hypothetical protein OEQ29_05785 [Alphaproteobacteria bacterium]|nr:hypothetical protein [Alphaproteobacteria bacterium]